jgi:hypothetical protein
MEEVWTHPPHEAAAEAKAGQMFWGRGGARRVCTYEIACHVLLAVENESVSHKVFCLLLFYTDKGVKASKE